MDKYQYFAVTHYLTEWPDGLSFSGIVNVLKNDNFQANITVNEAYELYADCDLAEFIKSMAISLRRAFS